MKKEWFVLVFLVFIMVFFYSDGVEGVEKGYCFEDGGAINGRAGFYYAGESTEWTFSENRVNTFDITRSGVRRNVPVGDKHRLSNEHCKYYHFEYQRPQLDIEYELRGVGKDGSLCLYGSGEEVEKILEDINLLGGGPLGDLGEMQEGNVAVESASENLEGEFLTDEFFQGAEGKCGDTPGAEEVGTFLDGEGNELRHCVKRKTFELGDSFIKHSYLQNAAENPDCESGERGSFFRDANGNTIFLCVEKIEAVSTSGLVFNVTIGASCSGFSQTSGPIEVANGSIVHCRKPAGSSTSTTASVQAFGSTLCSGFEESSDRLSNGCSSSLTCKVRISEGALSYYGYELEKDSCGGEKLTVDNGGAPISIDSVGERSANFVRECSLKYSGTVAAKVIGGCGGLSEDECGGGCEAVYEEGILPAKPGCEKKGGELGQVFARCVKSEGESEEGGEEFCVECEGKGIGDCKDTTYCQLDSLTGMCTASGCQYNEYGMQSIPVKVPKCGGGFDFEDFEFDGDGQPNSVKSGVHNFRQTGSSGKCKTYSFDVRKGCPGEGDNGEGDEEQVGPPYEAIAYYETEPVSHSFSVGPCGQVFTDDDYGGSHADECAATNENNGNLAEAPKECSELVGNDKMPGEDGGESGGGGDDSREEVKRLECSDSAGNTWECDKVKDGFFQKCAQSQGDDLSESCESIDECPSGESALGGHIYTLTHALSSANWARRDSDFSIIMEQDSCGILKSKIKAEVHGNADFVKEAATKQESVVQKYIPEFRMNHFIPRSVIFNGDDDDYTGFNVDINMDLEGNSVKILVGYTYKKCVDQSWLGNCRAWITKKGSPSRMYTIAPSKISTFIHEATNPPVIGTLESAVIGVEEGSKRFNRALYDRLLQCCEDSK